MEELKLRTLDLNIDGIIEKHKVAINARLVKMTRDDQLENTVYLLC